MKSNVYKFIDRSQRVKGFPFWGQEVCLIFWATDIEDAVFCFEKNCPQHCKGGKIKNTIAIQIIK